MITRSNYGALRKPLVALSLFGLAFCAFAWIASAVGGIQHTFFLDETPSRSWLTVSFSHGRFGWSSDLASSLLTGCNSYFLWPPTVLSGWLLGCSVLEGWDKRAVFLCSSLAAALWFCNFTFVTLGTRGCWLGAGMGQLYLYANSSTPMSTCNMYRPLMSNRMGSTGGIFLDYDDPHFSVRFEWFPRLTSDSCGCYSICIPLWILTALLIIAPVGFMRSNHRRARRKAGLCVTCGYNLQGLTEPRCPECSTPFERAS